MTTNPQHAAVAAQATGCGHLVCQQHICLAMEEKIRRQERQSRRLVSCAPFFFLLAAASYSLKVSEAFVSPLKHHSVKSRSTLQCKLFFRSKRPTARSSWIIPDAALNELSDSSVTFPYHLLLQSRNEEEQPKEVVIRTLEKEDLDTVVPMCVKEFGSSKSPITSIDQIPWEEIAKDSSVLDDVIERILFGPLVRSSLEMKINRQEVGDDPGRPNVLPDDTVLCAEFDGRVVAIVDLSRQPPDPERNPPPVPLPMFVKNLLSTFRGLPSPDGWVTNLLVDESFRGQGFSKLLMKAAEGLARSWGCRAIYLHVDADSVSGKVPQDLYRGLGYEPVIDRRSQTKYDWMGPELMNLGLYVIDEVPLLFLRKNITDSC